MDIQNIDANNVAETPIYSNNGQDIPASIRFDPVNYRRYIVISAYGAAGLVAPVNPGGFNPANPASGVGAGIVVERIQNGNRILANQSFEARSSNITFHASITDGFVIEANASLIFVINLVHQIAEADRQYFTQSQLLVRHATLALT